MLRILCEFAESLSTGDKLAWTLTTGFVERVCYPARRIKTENTYPITPVYRLKPLWQWMLWSICAFQNIKIRQYGTGYCIFGTLSTYTFNGTYFKKKLVLKLNCGKLVSARTTKFCLIWWIFLTNVVLWVEFMTPPHVLLLFNLP